MELSVNKRIRNIGIVLAVVLILITVIRLYYPLLPAYTASLVSSYSSSSSSGIAPASYHAQDDIPITDNQEKCDIFTGEWVPNPEAPYYTNKTCWAIHEHQNCMKYGRPDSGFMKWRWKPDGCDLPLFNPYQFLDMVRGKSLAFVGDSVGRNQMQSMICLLSRVEYPIDVSATPDEHFKRWRYETYNFTFGYFWSPFCRSEIENSDGPTHTGLFNLYLDEFDQSWTTQIDEFDYVILNAGHWFSRTAVYYENSHIVGCRFCQLPNTTDLQMTYGYRRVFRTAFKAINARENFKGVTISGTFDAVAFRERVVERGRELPAAAAVPEQRDASGGFESGSVHDSVGGVQGCAEGGEEENSGCWTRRRPCF
ncbi:protein trichome birefringence-like 19 [Sesamum angolense]|uniref:Protein trichome birefringence-like 19 n=1 Tax=Sesamum angolense TaxID=2727404 RepID=A0AAE1WHG5_9LAMI|nr:protein trichome birefringence-like 19 [Sesamum angolense]